MGKDKAQGDGQTLNGFNRRTGVGNRCYTSNSEYHLAPKCPLRDVPRSESAQSNSTIFMETPVNAQSANQSAEDGKGPACEQSYRATLDRGSQFLFVEEASVAVLHTGAAANLACFRRLARRNRILDRKGPLRVSTCPACARIKFGIGRAGEVRRAADVPVGNAGKLGKFTALCAGD